MRIQQTVDCLSGSMLSPAFGVEQETRRYRSLTMTLLEPVRRTRLDQVYYGPMERCSTWGRIPTLVHPAAPDRRIPLSLTRLRTHGRRVRTFPTAMLRTMRRRPFCLIATF